MDIWKSVRDAAQEIVDENETEDERSGAIMDYADSLVPSYTGDVIEEYTAIDIYDAEDYSGPYDIIAQMRAALYEWYYRELYAAVGRLVADEDGS